jgi:hypothetical protein
MSGCLIGGGCILLVVGVIAIIVAVVIFMMARKRGAPQPAPAPRSVPQQPSSAPFRPAKAEPFGATLEVPAPAGETYGSIVFVSGPLSGRRFPVTAQGAWIGREAPAEIVVSAPTLLGAPHLGRCSERQGRGCR